MLAAMLSTFGSAGLAAAAERPALLATIDQHAAAIRDRLAPTALGRTGGLPARPAIRGSLLAAYAVGVRDAALDLGWQPPAEPVDWSEPDWVLTRLLAVCALAGSPPVPGTAPSDRP